MWTHSNESVRRSSDSPETRDWLTRSGLLSAMRGAPSAMSCHSSREISFFDVKNSTFSPLQIAIIVVTMGLGYIIACLATTPTVQATYIWRWHLGGHGSGVSERCTELPSEEYSDVGQPVGGSVHSHLERDSDDKFPLSLVDSGEQGHPGFIDAEEAALPPKSYHDAYGNQIDWDEYNRFADLELEHEANGTLHLLYPDLYEAPLKKRGHPIDISIYVDKGCHGERLARIHTEGCHNTTNGAGIFMHSLPNNCEVLTYTRAHCKGGKHLDIGHGAAQGCFDSGNFNSLRVKCAVP